MPDELSEQNWAHMVSPDGHPNTPETYTGGTIYAPQVRLGVSNPE
jgi:hypothetical protein